MPRVLIWWRNMLLPARRLTPMSAIAFTIYGARVIRVSDRSRSSMRVRILYRRRRRARPAQASSDLRDRLFEPLGDAHRPRVLRGGARRSKLVQRHSRLVQLF